MPRYKINVPHYHGVGSARHYAICDVCGFKFRSNLLTMVNDKWSTQNGLLVCAKDKDKVNPQIRLEALKIRYIPGPNTVRPEQETIYDAPGDNDGNLG